MLSVLDFAALRKVVDHDAVIMMIIMMMMILGCSFCKVLSLGSCGVSLRAASCQTLIADLEFAVPHRLLVTNRGTRTRV
jgi:hypothetical protein